MKAFNDKGEEVQHGDKVSKLISGDFVMVQNNPKHQPSLSENKLELVGGRFSMQFKVPNIEELFKFPEPQPFATWTKEFDKPLSLEQELELKTLARLGRISYKMVETFEPYKCAVTITCPIEIDETD